jgi:hypothetical protein
VEAVVAELNLPAIKEDSTTWRIDADVGTVYFGVDDEGDVLTIWQLLMSLKDPEKPKKHAEFFEDLLAVNRDTRGACLAIDKTFEAGQKWLMVLARLRAPTLDAPEFAMAMEDVFATSKMFDPPDSTDSE